MFFLVVQTLLRNCHLPPQASIFAEAFGLNMTQRRSLAYGHQTTTQLSPSMSPDMKWRLKYLMNHIGEGQLFNRHVFPTLEQLHQVIQDSCSLATSYN